MTDQGSLSELEREQLAQQYLPVVHIIVKEICDRLPVYMHMDDLLSAAQWGLTQALVRYQKGREANFMTFARHRIRGAILDELRRIDPMPRAQRRKAKQHQQIREELCVQLGREPEEDEVDRVLPKRRQQPIPYCILSLELPTVAAEIMRVTDTIDDAEQQVIGIENAEMVRAAMALLPAEEREVLELHYGQGLPLREVAASVGPLNASISQVRALAVDHLRHAYAVVCRDRLLGRALDYARSKAA